MSTINTINNTATSSENTHSDTTQQPQQKDVDDFTRSLREHNQEEHAQEKNILQKKTPGDAILSGLLTQQATGSTIKSTQIESIQSPKISDDIIQKLVDSILVSSKDSVQEVRIQVNQNVLADTNIILRMDEGKLFVQLHTSNTQSALTLHQNVQQLESNLQNSCKDKEISVKIIEADPASQGSNKENSKDQQSRGHFLWDEHNEKS